MYTIVFQPKAKKQFYKLNREAQTRITKAIDDKLSINPKSALIPLMGDKSGLYKFRVGDYRLLCSRDDDKLHVLVIKVKHRRDVYKS